MKVHLFLALFCFVAAFVCLREGLKQEVIWPGVSLFVFDIFFGVHCLFECFKAWKQEEE
jgi:hypothetical protein